MARKSSKTAHVLNLLSGHDSRKEQSTEYSGTEASQVDSQNTSTVSIIDHSKSDPVAELIQDKLSDSFKDSEHSNLSASSDKDDAQISEVSEKEPDFICVNVMESIVKQKIIYYMRQFDCCTCDHCIADTVALTLNNLSPKYIVTSPSAEDPLISFYTNKFISDITVEATKACMIVKENPRH